jgi:hypothetical protein
MIQGLSAHIVLDPSQKLVVVPVKTVVQHHGVAS